MVVDYEVPNGRKFVLLGDEILTAGLIDLEIQGFTTVAMWEGGGASGTMCV